MFGEFGQIGGGHGSVSIASQVDYKQELNKEVVKIHKKANRKYKPLLCVYSSTHKVNQAGL